MRTWLLICFILSLSLAARTQSLQKVSYTMRVTLDVKHRALEGFWELHYTNQSTDTLHELWLQLWPNAYRNDRTAYSEHLLDSGVNDFYFSGTDAKGYINRLVFQSGEEVLAAQDDARYIDIQKLLLAKPLPPGKSITITTPFHVELPYAFSGFGFHDHSFDISNWYPAVARYSAEGWQPQPFTGQDNTVRADYHVAISLPAKYIVRTDAVRTDSMVSDSMKTVHLFAADAVDLRWSAEPRGTVHRPAKKTFEKGMMAATSKVLAQRILPVPGYNVYDGFQLGVLIHNFRIPEHDLSYFAAPAYAFNSRTVTGSAGVSYNLKPANYFKKISIGVNLMRNSDNKGVDTPGKKIFTGFYKIAPYVRFAFPTTDKHLEKWLEWRTFIIGESSFAYVQYAADSLYYPTKGPQKTRYLNQLTFRETDYRSLYPYDWQLQLQQASGFYRLNAEAHYYFNYADGGGLQTRLFAAKFGYLGQKDYSATYRFQPKLTAVRGDEDYTYSNVFFGRNEFAGLGSQQIMMRDGGLKLRTDNFQDLQGRSDNWVASMNLSTTLPAPPFPKNFPLRVFLDVGTYAGAWKKGTDLPRFLYVGGLQLSLFKDLLNIYAPLVYSSQFRDNLKTIPEENGFFKKISFSLDIQRFNPRRIIGNRINN